MGWNFNFLSLFLAIIGFIVIFIYPTFLIYNILPIQLSRKRKWILATIPYWIFWAAIILAIHHVGEVGRLF